MCNKNTYDWKPIESAPKTGVNFLVYDANEKEILMCKWSEKKKKFIILYDGASSSVEEQMFKLMFTDWMAMVPPVKT